MEVVRTSKTSASFNETTLCKTREEIRLHTRCRENLKNDKFKFGQIFYISQIYSKLLL